MSVSGALFDMIKFNDVSKNVISVMTAEQVYNLIVDWAKDYNKVLYDLFVANSDKAKAIINIDRDNPKPRKDLACWEDVENYVSFFYNELYAPDYTLPENIKKEDAIEILTKYKDVYSYLIDVGLNKEEIECIKRKLLGEKYVR
jgi:glutamyl-tRNA synthetase